MGYPIEAVHQNELYQYKQLYLSEISIKLERHSIHYWMIATDIKHDFEDDTTLLLPRPFGHDQFQPIVFNTQITPPEFTASYQIYSSQFMQAYYLIRAASIAAFMDVSDAETWLSIRKKKLYVFVPKVAVDYRVDQLDNVLAEVKKEAAIAICLAQKIEKLMYKIKKQQR